MEPLLLLVRKGSILMGMLVSLFGALNFGGGDLFPGVSFGNVRVMSLYTAEREE